VTALSAASWVNSPLKMAVGNSTICATLSPRFRASAKYASGIGSGDSSRRFGGLRPHSLRDPAREEADRRQRRYGHGQRQEQHRQLAGFQVAPQISQCKTQDLHRRQLMAWSVMA
jgi:hypothetical protein